MAAVSFNELYPKCWALPGCWPRTWSALRIKPSSFYVFTLSDGRILLEPWNLKTNFQLVAGPANGFVSAGQAGISDDGRVIAFVGNLSAAAAATINTEQARLGLRLTPLTPGWGVFVSAASAAGPVSSARYLQKIAGVSGDGNLDPGEGYVDTNANGIFERQSGDLDYTTYNPVSGFHPDVRVSVARLAGTDEYQLAYVGAGALSNGAPKTIYTSYLRLPTATAKSAVSAPTTVVRVGEDVPNLGRLADLNIHDALNSRGELAFYAKSIAGVEGILRARQTAGNIVVLKTEAVSTSLVRVKYRIDGKTLDRSPTLDLLYSTSSVLDAASYETQRVLATRRVVTLPTLDDNAKPTNAVGEHEVTLYLTALVGQRTELAPTRARFRYVYAQADPLNEIREMGTTPSGRLDDLLALSSKNDNVRRLGYVDAQTLVAAMNHGSVPRKLTVAAATRFVEPLNEAMSEYLIFTIPQQATFLAQISHESSYRSDGLVQWGEVYVLNVSQKINSRPAYVATSAQNYFNYWYGPNPAHPSPGKGLGNTQPGDGYKFRGRGPKQLTGRDNYKRAGDKIGVDLIANPDLVETNPSVGFRVAAWFFGERTGGVAATTPLAVANQITEATTPGQLDALVKSIGSIINGATNGLAERQAYTRQILRLMRYPSRHP